MYQQLSIKTSTQGLHPYPFPVPRLLLYRCVPWQMLMVKKKKQNENLPKDARAHIDGAIQHLISFDKG